MTRLPRTPAIALQIGMVLVIGCTFFATISQLVAGDNFPQPPDTEKSTDPRMSAEEMCRTAKLPPGFKLSVFAAEPDVQNPMSITTDERGRLWVAENYTWAGADAGVFDPKLRDRILIFEDTNGDGAFDKRTVFYDRASRLTSIQVGQGGAWLLCPPQLLFLPDRNRDDVPDGPPEVVLDGFDIKSVVHTVANGLKWGPDGWLYGRQGILGTSKVGVPGTPDDHRIVFNTAVWRYHPQRRICEVVMHGMTNPWGFDYDQFGEMYVGNTVIGHLWQVIPGGRTERMFGADLNPNAYQLLPQTADHVHWDTSESWDNVRKGVTDHTSAAGGGHAHTGLMIYQGDNWPAEYRGNAYMLNLHGRRINCDVLQPNAVGTVARHSADMCFWSDPWFRGMDLISGTDGGVFIADWSDTGECHEIGGVHRTSGRIYKLTYATPTAQSPVNLAAVSDLELVKLQQSSNDWYSRQARLQLQERAAAGSLDKAAVRDALQSLFGTDPDPVHRIRAMWALQVAQIANEDWLVAQLNHADEHVRAWAVRFLADAGVVYDKAPSPRVVQALQELASREKSGLVLLHLAAALQKLPDEARWSIAEVIARKQDQPLATNRRLAIMLWLAIEPLVPQNQMRSTELLTRASFPLLRENIARRLAFEIHHDVKPVEKLLAIAVEQPRLTAEILSGLSLALDGQKRLPVPANWGTTSAKLLPQANEQTRDQLYRLGIAFNDAQTLAALRLTAEDTSAKPELRNRALQLLVIAHPNDLVPLLRRMLLVPPLAIQAIQGLAEYDDSAIPAAILDNFQQLPPESRVVAVNTLTSRKLFAQALLDALEQKKLAASDISATHARQIIALGDAELNDKLRLIWGDTRQTSDEKRAAIQNLKSMLTPKLAAANREAGRSLFQRTCASCHVLFGQGGKIGPELTGSNRKNLDYLLENIVDPSAVVGAQFRVSTFVLADGRVITGVIQNQNDRTITIGTADGSHIVDRQDIDEVAASEKSLMPDGLLQGVSDDQVRDLAGYLMSE
jgi:putative membrane-bound dehydrogenase-like protein